MGREEALKVPTVISRTPKYYSYRADGVHVLTPRVRGTFKPTEEVIPYQTLTEREKKAQKRLDAIRRKNNCQPLKRIVK